MNVFAAGVFLVMAFVFSGLPAHAQNTCYMKDYPHPCIYPGMPVADYAQALVVYWHDRVTEDERSLKRAQQTFNDDTARFKQAQKELDLFNGK